ncbi:MAG: PEGA domain-containing protein [Phycisphaerales bacterium]
MRATHAIWTAALAASIGGCGSQERVITITTDPPGALCYLNDVELGRTPCDTTFKFFGTYDVRLVLDGYETLYTSRDTEQPWYELPGIDLAAAALPGVRRTDVRWAFVLNKAPASDADEPALLERARQLRGQVAGDPSATALSPAAASE